MRRILLALVLLSIPTAAAVYIETPLRATATPAEGNVGDVIDVDVEPANATEAARLAGKTVLVKWATVEEETANRDAGTLTLGDDGRGAFAWTVPQDADGLNVFLVFELDGERLGQVYVRVGDAEPMMFTTGAPSGSGGAIEETPPPADDMVDDESTEKNEAPGLTAGLIVGAALVAVLFLAARRR